MICILKINRWTLGDISKNFRKIYLKVFHLDRVKFHSAPGLVYYATLKKAEVKLELLTDTDMLLMAEEWIRLGITLEEEYVMQFINMQKPIINIWKNMIKIKNHHILNIEM